MGAFIHGELDTINVYDTKHPAALAGGEAGAAKGQRPLGVARAELGRALPNYGGDAVRVSRSAFVVRRLERRNVWL